MCFCESCVFAGSVCRKRVMSRWLKSVNNILETLDDQAENVVPAEGAAAVRGLTNLLRVGPRDSDDEDDSYYESQDESDQEDDESVNDTNLPSQGEALLARELSMGDGASDESNLFDMSNEISDESDAAKEEKGSKRKFKEPSQQTTSSELQMGPTNATNVILTDTRKSREGTPSRYEANNDIDQDGTNASTGKKPSVEAVTTNIKESAPPNVPLPKAPSSGRSSSRPAAPPSGNTALKRAQSEISRLQKQLVQATARAEAAEKELHAQHDELEAAAERLKADQVRRVKEEEEAWEDAQWELEQQAAKYKQAMQVQQEEYEKKLAQAQLRLQQVEAHRKQEGGNLSEEVQQAIARERDALERAEDLANTLSILEQEKKRSEQRQVELETQVATLQATVERATLSEQKLEAEMDALKEIHQRQLNQRQEREFQLEQSLAQLSAALAMEKQRNPVSLERQTNLKGDDDEYKKKVRELSEELAVCKGQLDWSNQRCEALQNELQVLSQERLVEAEQARERQESFDAEMARVHAELNRLKSGKDIERDLIKETSPNIAPPTVDDAVLRASKEQMKDLSDQLLRQQSLVDKSKSEILALKGRLQSALQRAEAAEQEVRQSQGHTNDVEHGTTGLNRVNHSWSTMGQNTRRRKRGGRTMRSALGIRASGSPFVTQVAHTIDSVDLWMLETGLILKQEPMARLGLLAYALLLHFWCFALVCFHAVESEHGDLGALTSHRTVISPHSLT